jgi:iron complex outermembrane recepter protein
LGIATPLPVSGDPLGIWHILEETQAGFLMANLRGMDMRLDGNAGMRVVKTRENVTGNQTDPTGGGAILPMAIASEYTDLLPSANVRYLLQEGMYLRGALSKTLSRPDFSQLSPSLRLIRNSVDPTQSTGSAGNPALKPVRSDNLDLALERYFDASTSVFVTAFYKRAEGFPVSVVTPETYSGTTYQVNRPQNMNPAHISGAEIGYQQFYDFLHGWMKGLGLLANYTYVDGRTSSSLLGQNAPLPNLSANSYNLVGMYERDKVSARLAYNWRSKFLSSIGNYAGVGAVPIYTQAYGWLDASLAYRIDKKTTLIFEAGNLLRTMRSSYYGAETRPYSSFINDRQFSLALSFSHF